MERSPARRADSPEAGLRLLPLLDRVDGRKDLTTPIGADSGGVPLYLNLSKAATWHVRVQASESRQAADVLRTIIIGLAASSRPSELQIAGIDLNSGGFGFLEELPHGLTETALRVDFAVEILAWLAGEIAIRRSRAGRRPHLAVAIDDLARLEAQAGRAAGRFVNRILAEGAQAGVHLLAAAGAASQGFQRQVRWDESAALVFREVRLGEGFDSGRALAASAGRSTCIQVARVPAADLDALVRRLSRAGEGGRTGSRRVGGRSPGEPGRLGW